MPTFTLAMKTMLMETNSVSESHSGFFTLMPFISFTQTVLHYNLNIKSIIFQMQQRCTIRASEKLYEMHSLIHGLNSEGKMNRLLVQSTYI